MITLKKRCLRMTNDIYRKLIFPLLALVVIMPSFLDWSNILGERSVYISSPVYIDRDNSYEPEKALLEQFDDLGIPNFGYRDWTIWVRIRTPKGNNLILEYDHSSIEEFIVYRIGDDRKPSFLGTYGSNHFDKSSNYYGHRNFNLKVEGDTEYLLRVRSKSSLKVPLRIWNERDFHNYSVAEYSIFSLLYGFLISFFITNLIYGFTVRNRSHFLYCIFIVSFIFLHLSIDGLLTQYLPNALSQYRMYQNLFLFLAFGISNFIYISFFLRAYSEGRSTSDRVKRAIGIISYIIAIFWLFYASIMFFFPYNYVLSIGHLIVLISSVLFLITSFYVRSGYQGYDFFKMSILLQLISYVVYMGKSWSIFPLNIYTAHSTKIIYLMEFTFLSLANSGYIRSIYQKAKIYEVLSLSFGKLVHESKKLFEKIMLANRDKLDDKEIESLKNDTSAVEYLLDEFAAVAGNRKITKKVDMKPVSLATILREIKNDYDSCEHNHSIDLLFGHSLKPIGNSYLLRSVFKNLIENALAATEKYGTKIVIATENSHDMVEVTISNTNSYLSSSGNVFEPFVSSTNPKGSGLGLFICKSITDLHGGRIELTSQRGKVLKTIVKIGIPSGTVEDVLCESQPAKEHTINAIFIDDMLDDVHKFISYYHQKFHVRIRALAVLTDPDAALDVIEGRDSSVDYIFVDRFLSGMDITNINVPKIFRDHGYEGKIILLSSCPADNWKELGFDQSFDKSEVRHENS